MTRLYASFALVALSALATFAPDTGGGSDPAGQSPAQNPASPEAGKPADAQPPKAPDAPAPSAGRSARRTHIVWAAAGHPTFAPGAILTATEDQAEALRAAGRARRASAEEVKALPKGLTVPEFG